MDRRTDSEGLEVEDGVGWSVPRETVMRLAYTYKGLHTKTLRTRVRGA